MDIDELLRIAMQRGASDVHLAVPASPMLRICNDLSPVGLDPLTPLSVKEAFESITSEKQQDMFYKDLELDFAYSISGVGRFRVNAALQRGSIVLTFRCLPLRIPGVEELGLPDICKSLIMRRKGLVLVTGPTSSGKSTTQAAMIEYLNELEKKKVTTIEDPVEFLHTNKKCLIVQRDLGDDTTSFASAMRHALRQNSDVILVGELRDVDTTAAAITAAETGHLVLATAHTQGAANVIDRLISEFPPAHQEQARTQFALVLEAVLSQTLIPRADGQGRVVAVEIMLANYAIRNLIREKKVHQIPAVIETASNEGMMTLDQSLAELISKSLITIDEALLRAQRPEELQRLFVSNASYRRRSDTANSRS